MLLMILLPLFMVVINVIYTLECGTVKAQKIQVLYADFR